MLHYLLYVTRKYPQMKKKKTIYTKPSFYCIVYTTNSKIIYHLYLARNLIDIHMCTILNLFFST